MCGAFLLPDLTKHFRGQWCSTDAELQHATEEWLKWQSELTWWLCWKLNIYLFVYHLSEYAFNTSIMSSTEHRNIFIELFIMWSFSSILNSKANTDQEVRKPRTQNLKTALMKRRGRNVKIKRNPSTHWKNPYVMNCTTTPLTISTMWWTVN